MRPKPEEKKRARELRAGGNSLKEISRKLSVSVASVVNWTRDIDLTEAQKLDIAKRCGRTSSWKQACLEKREACQEEGRADAKAGSTLHAMGCMLYWGEGSKGRNSVQMTNSDPRMMTFFVRFLRECFRVDDDQMVVGINCFTDCATLEEIEQFWLSRLGLPRKCLRKSIVNNYSRASDGKRKGKLKYGTCRLSVHDTRMVQRIFGAIQEYAGFKDETWVQ